MIHCIVIAANGCGRGFIQLQHVAEDPDPDVQQDLLLQLHQQPRCYEQWSQTLAQTGKLLKLNIKSSFQILDPCIVGFPLIEVEIT